MGSGWRWVGVLVLAAGVEAWAEGPREAKTVAMATAPNPMAGAADGAGAGVELVRPAAAAAAAEDPCGGAVVSQPARPMWTAGAQTTQCGVMENDLGWHSTALGGGVRQSGLTSAERYGITRFLDITWAVPLRVVQSGGGMEAVGGITDQMLSAMVEFRQQGRRVPAMAVSYGVKIPTANPVKGFGTGFADHQLAFLASRDAGRVHFDFNAVELFAGTGSGHDEAAQTGLVMSVPVPGVKGLGWMVETDGGAQPGTADRVGQSLTGFSWAARPNVVFDTAVTWAWTAGSPRQQFTMGVTWAHRMRGLRAPAGVSRWLGR